MLALLPIKMGLKMYWNLGKNLGVVCLEIWGLAILSVQIEITETAINIIRAKRKERQIQLQALSFGAVFVHHFVNTVFRYINVREISIFTDIAKRGDAFFTSIINGIILQFLQGFYAIILGLKGNLTAYCSVNMEFGEDKASVSDYICVKLAPIILVVCVVRAFLRTKKGIAKYGKYAK